MAARIQQVAATITAIGSVTPWIKHSYYQSPFNVGLSVFFDSALAATLAVQFIADDQSQTAERTVLLSQSGTTTATITDNGPYTINGAPANANWGGPFGHGLLSNDVIFLNGSQAGVDSGLQSYPVTVTGVNTYTVTVPVSQTITNYVARVTSGRLLTHPTLTALTARANAGYTNPVWMSRLICTAFTTAGKAYLVAMQGDNP
jgi:hypothetical protein